MTFVSLCSDKEELLPDPDEQSSVESLAIPESPKPDKAWGGALDSPGATEGPGFVSRDSPPQNCSSCDFLQLFNSATETHFRAKQNRWRNFTFGLFDLRSNMWSSVLWWSFVDHHQRVKEKLSRIKLLKYFLFLSAGWFCVENRLDRSVDSFSLYWSVGSFLL